MKSLNTIFTLAIAFLFACGGGGESQNQQQEAEPASESSQVQSASDDVRTIELIGVDQMKYVVADSQEGVYTSDSLTGSGGETYVVVDSIAADPGQKLRIKLTNVSSLPPSAMSHNFALLELGTDAQAFANASAQAKDNDYIAPDLEDQVIVATEMVGGGKSDSISFTTPEKTGKYDYVCSFPGHFAAGMKGKLIVQE